MACDGLLKLCIVCRTPLKDDGTCFSNCDPASPTRKVGVCGVPHDMTIVDGGVMFSDKAGFWGVSGRFMWEYKCHLWYLVCSEDSFGTVAGCHLKKMHELLTEMIGADHEQFELKWKDQR